MKVKYFFVFLLLGAISICSAQSKKIDFTEYDLSNGLHVILHKDTSTPIVAISVLYHVGSKNEQPNRTGFAHFFEHLMFEGSPNIKRGEFMKIVQNNGGELNANTTQDRTYYYDLLPSNQLELGLWLESERMFHLKIDSVGVETQRKVVKEEKKQRLDNQPYGTVIQETFSHAYKVHPYRWVPIGSAQYIDKATLQEFKDFHKEFYVPNNAVLTIVGDINIDQTKKWVEKYFGTIPKGTEKIYRPTVVEPPQTAEVRDTVYDNIQLPLVLFAYHIPKENSKDAYALDMLTTLLSKGKSSRMYKNLVDKQQVALQAGAFPMSLEDPGLFLTYAIANAGKTGDELEKAMNEQINSVIKKGLTDKEFEKLRNQEESSFVNSNSTDAGVAASLSNYYVFYHNTNLINTELDKYMAVTKADIQRVAKKYLTKKNRVVLYYLPKSAKK